MEAPRKIPANRSLVRSVLSETNSDMNYKPLSGFEEAKNDPEGVAIFEADYGGQIMMTIRMKYVKCSERTLDLLLFDLNALAWGDADDDKGTGLYYERLPVGGGVAGGMEGGSVVDGVWAHPRFEKDGVDMTRLGQAVGDILEGRADRLPGDLSKPHDRTE